MLTDLIGCRPVPVQLTSLYGELIEAFLQLRNNTAVTSYRLPIFWENWADTFVGHRNRFFDTSKELGSSNFRFKSIVKEARETVALFCHRLSIFPFTDEMKIFHPSGGVGRKSGGGGSWVWKTLSLETFTCYNYPAVHTVLVLLT